jgi:hypothetical protein
VSFAARRHKDALRHARTALGLLQDELSYMYAPSGSWHPRFTNDAV